MVTGSSGFIGRHLKKALPDADGLSRTPSPTTSIVSDILSPPPSVNDYDIVYHLAAIVGTERSVRNPIDVYRVNVCGTLNLIQSFKGLLIFLSTIGVYEPLRNHYFLSKYVCEKVIRASPCDHLIFRLTNPYGVGSQSVVQKWLKTDHIRIYGDGTQTRDFTYIDDIVDVISDPSKFRVNNTYNVGTGIQTQLNELATQIVKLTREKKIEHFPSRKFEMYRSSIDPDVLCKTSLKEGLMKSLEKMELT